MGNFLSITNDYPHEKKFKAAVLLLWKYGAQTPNTASELRYAHGYARLSGFLWNQSKVLFWVWGEHLPKAAVMLHVLVSQFETTDGEYR